MTKELSIVRFTDEIRSPRFESDLHLYITHAAHLLCDKGMGETLELAPCAAQARDIVDEVIVDGLTGVREWKEGDPFPTFFRDAIKSEACHRCRRERARQAEQLDDIAEPPAPSSRRMAVRAARQELARVREALSGDHRTKAWLEAIEDGAEKRREVAEKTGWDPEYVSIVRIVAKRMLDAAGVREDAKNEKKVGR